MAKHRQANRTGRSSGKMTSMWGKALKPEPPFLWYTTDLMKSPAWRAMSINTRKLIDFLTIEHFGHAGQENGSLKATYDQLVAFGLTREHIAEAIDEAEALGLARRMAARQMRVPMVYRLTFYASNVGGLPEPPTNDWKRVTDETVTHIKADLATIRKSNELRRQKKKAAPDYEML